MPSESASTSSTSSVVQEAENLKPLLNVYEIVTPEIVNKVFNYYDPNLQVVSYEVKSGTEYEHFNSIMYRITVNLKNRNGGGGVSPVQIMFKSIPQNTIRIACIRDAKLFLKEAQMYQDVLPMLTDSGRLLTTFPRVFDAFSDGRTDYIAMEDLEVSGYQMADRLAGLDWAQSVLTVKELAKFHALSFIKYKGDGDKMQSDFPEIKEHFWVFADPMPEMQQQFISNTMRDIENVMKDEKLEHFIPRIRKEFVDDIFERISLLCSVPKDFPAAFSHGDFWTNNIMYKYSKDGHPEKLKFIDFQKAMINSRCTDLAYVIYTSVSTPVLNDKMESLLKLYFDAFNEFCSELGSQTSLTFRGHELTWDYFKEEWEFYHHFGLIFGLMLIPLMYATSEDMPDMELLDITDIKSKDDQENSFSTIWKSRTMRDKLINLISKHLPE